MGRLQSFSMDMPYNDPEAMKEFQKLMDTLHDEAVLYIKQLATDLGVSEEWASDIYYLRSRSRWSQGLEDELISMAKAGEARVNIFEWP